MFGAVVPAVGIDLSASTHRDVDGSSEAQHVNHNDLVISGFDQGAESITTPAEVDSHPGQSANDRPVMRS